MERLKKFKAYDAQKTTTPGKVIGFLALTVGGGLLQLWVLSITLMSTGKTVKISEVLGDGGLFFFSTSLACTSFLSLIDKNSLEFGSVNFNITLVILTPVSLYAVVSYSSVLSASSGRGAYPFGGHTKPQIICAIAALVYAFYVCTVTGFFHEND